MTRRHRTGSRSGTRARSETAPSRTISVSLSDRGQTTQDFAVGIGIFILTVAFVFMYVPSLAAPHDSSIGGAETAQVDRLADRIVEGASTGTPNELNATLFQDTFAEDPEDLVGELGLRSSDGVVIDRVNVTIEPIGSGTVNESNWSGGHHYDNQTAASSARVVTVDSLEDECDPACRLIVRVW